ncbi:MAG: YicC/YloC family endoribonuclease [Flavobacteriales bacterium]|nr:YicC/YloC family endoribonuclease [Flavobacteriales bacterium]
MIQSMTGYGKAELNLTNANFTIEVRSLNSKQIDANVKMSSIYRDKEIGLRKLLSEKLQRGKIELSIWREKSESNSKYTLNTELIKEYFTQIEEITNILNLNNKDMMSSILKMPEVLVKGEEKADDNEWLEIQKGVDTAIANILQFRLDEGKKLETDITARINTLARLLVEVAPFANNRIEKIKKSLADKLAEIDTKNIDENRFEQELIYYLEKQDITEEQVRLDAHLDYFIETMKTESPNGKKLGFIGQEIGREINTIGSKSSDAGMQKIVVEMKDELEKIKEQLLNIL